MRQLLSTINRVAPSVKPQEVANTIWGLATLGWQAGEGPMRGALEAAAVRVAPSMKPQEVANTIWGLATCISRDQGSNRCASDGRDQAQNPASMGHDG